jgi:hypothetical protein
MSDLAPLDPMQTVFDAAEVIAQALDHHNGCEDALLDVLDPHLAQLPDRGRRVFAIIEAMRRFRLEATEETRRLVTVSTGAGERRLQ